MRSFPYGLLGFALTLTFAAPAAAQLVRGTVTDGETGEAINGGVVVLLDAAGERVGGTITRPNGCGRRRPAGTGWRAG